MVRTVESPSINFDNNSQNNGYLNHGYSFGSMQKDESKNSNDDISFKEVQKEIPTISGDIVMKEKPVEELQNEQKLCTPCQPNRVTIKTFTIMICVLQCVNAYLGSGYLMSVLSTIEKQFDISSRMSGFVVSSYEIGSLSAVVFVSYFGNHGHVPRWIGIGGLVLSVGSFLFALPQVLHSTGSKINCTVEDNSGLSYPTCDVQTSPFKTQVPTNDTSSDSASQYVFILIIAQVMLGAGGCPLFPLGTTYIDNNAEKSQAALYIAMMYIMTAIGPVLGFLCGALLLTNHVWWGGFVICGFMYFFSSLPFLCFPRRVREPSENNDKTGITKPTYGRSWKKIPVSIYRLATNSVYMITTITYCTIFYIVTGFTTFLPKYIETQFGLQASLAGLITGVVAVPAICIGIYFGGWVIKRFKLEMNGVAIFVIIVNAISAAFLLLFFVFGCSNPPIAGLTTSYNASFQFEDQNITDQCNQNCRCNLQSFDKYCKSYVNNKPICLGNITYVTACHAGCRSFTPFIHNETWIGQCSCNELQSSGTLGVCHTNCHMLIPFLIMLFAVCIVASNNQMPLVYITLRSVSEEEKAFALGVQTVISRLLCFIPAPLMYGAVIDTACMLWSSGSTSQKSGSCEMYDLNKFRNRFAGLSSVIMAVGLLFTLLAWVFIRKRFAMNRIANQDLPVTNKDAPVRSWNSHESLYSGRPTHMTHRKCASCG